MLWVNFRESKGKEEKGKLVYDKIKLIKSRSQKVNTFAAK